MAWGSALALASVLPRAGLPGWAGRCCPEPEWQPARSRRLTTTAVLSLGRSCLAHCPPARQDPAGRSPTNCPGRPPADRLRCWHRPQPGNEASSGLAARAAPERPSAHCGCADICAHLGDGVVGRDRRTGSIRSPECWGLSAHPTQRGDSGHWTIGPGGALLRLGLGSWARSSRCPGRIGARHQSLSVSTATDCAEKGNRAAPPAVWSFLQTPRTSPALSVAAEHRHDLRTQNPDQSLRDMSCRGLHG